MDCLQDFVEKISSNLNSTLQTSSLNVSQKHSLTSSLPCLLSYAFSFKTTVTMLWEMFFKWYDSFVINLHVFMLMVDLFGWEIDVNNN